MGFAGTTPFAGGAYTRGGRILQVALRAALSLLAAGCGEERGHAGAQDRARVVLRATSAAGVPLHSGERTADVSGRLPDGCEVEVLRWSADRRWLEVRAIDGTRGWITARYVAPEGTPATLDPWSSREACLASIRERPPRDPARARLVSWNLRWFPDGSSGGPSASASDVAWIACLLTSLRADAVALQEIRLNERGRLAVEQLRARLDALTGGRWEARFDRCPRDGRQHVGWLVDASRARVLGERQLDAVNPRGGCASSLRPAHAVRLRFARGLDLSAVVAHLDSGQSPRDHGHRQASYRAIARAARELAREHGDDDVLVLGDLNTMGCGECAPAIDAATELAALDALAGPALRRVAPGVACTELYRGEGTLLDHVLAPRAMRELARAARVEVHGPCAAYSCRLPRGARPPMLEHLSDHCPIVIELDARDLD